MSMHQKNETALIAKDIDHSTSCTVKWKKQGTECPVQYAIISYAYSVLV